MNWVQHVTVAFSVCTLILGSTKKLFDDRPIWIFVSLCVSLPLITAYSVLYFKRYVLHEEGIEVIPFWSGVRFIPFTGVQRCIYFGVIPGSGPQLHVFYRDVWGAERKARIPLGGKSKAVLNWLAINCAAKVEHL